jgi:hypothetical protein
MIINIIITPPRIVSLVRRVLSFHFLVIGKIPRTASSSGFFYINIAEQENDE